MSQSLPNLYYIDVIKRAIERIEENEKQIRGTDKKTDKED